MTVFVDSSVWIDYFSERDTSAVRSLERLLDTDDLAVCDLVVAEVLQGIKADREFDRVRQRFLAMEVRTASSPAIAVASALNFRLLRSRGITVRNTIDCLLATYVLSVDGELLTVDHDFQPFADHLGLRLASTDP